MFLETLGEGKKYQISRFLSNSNLQQYLSVSKLRHKQADTGEGGEQGRAAELFSYSIKQHRERKRDGSNTGGLKLRPADL